MVSVIRGIATALPDLSLAQSDSYSYATDLCCDNSRQARVLRQLYKKTGIERRSTVLMTESKLPTDFFTERQADFASGPTTAMRMRRYSEEAGKLASLSSERALLEAGVSARSVTHLITASCTGVCAPGFDLEIMHNLGLSRSVYRTHIGFMGCHGGMNAMRVGAAFAAAEPDAVILVSATELCSLHFQYGWESNNLVANSLFADGSASVVLRNQEPSQTAPAVLNTRSFVIPESLDMMTWKVSDHGFVMTLAPEVPQTIETHLPGFMNRWLEDNRLQVKDISGWAVHPGGPRILDAVESSLRLNNQALSQSREILNRCGNMSSPTVLFILRELLSASVPYPYVILVFQPV